MKVEHIAYGYPGDKPSDGGHFVTVSRQEALSLIESLAHQLGVGSPNSGRAEFWDADRKMFTIAVDDTVNEAATCGATDSSGHTCNLQPNHPGGRFHAEMRDGKLWAEWGGDARSSQVVSGTGIPRL